jgi:hypothetical protein
MAASRQGRQIQQTPARPAGEKTMSKSLPFILVFRPHTTPAWAETFRNEQDFINAWVNGDFTRRCSADGSDASDEPTFDEAYAAVSHDLHNLTRLDNADEVQRYLSDEGYAGHHNKGYGAVAQAARELGWLHEEPEE